MNVTPTGMFHITPVLKTFANCTRSQHATEMLVVSGLCVVVEQLVVAIANSLRIASDTHALSGDHLMFCGLCTYQLFGGTSRGELSYLAPLGSGNISAPYFKQCFFRGWGGLPSQTESNTTPPSPKTEITNILFYILNFASIIKFKM